MVLEALRCRAKAGARCGAGQCSDGGRPMPARGSAPPTVAVILGHDVRNRTSVIAGAVPRRRAPVAAAAGRGRRPSCGAPCRAAIRPTSVSSAEGSRGHATAAAAGAPAGARCGPRPPPSPRVEFGVPVKKIPPAFVQKVWREGATVFLELMGGRLLRSHERPHPADVRQPVALGEVARGAGGDDVVPGRSPTQRPRDHMVEGQVVGRQPVAAVLAAEPIAQEHVEPRERRPARGWDIFPSARSRWAAAISKLGLRTVRS